MSDKLKTIRFIDSDYKELFKIPDGGSIKVIYPPGDDRGTVSRQCKFIDESHVEISRNGSYRNVYHMAEFAERMEAIGAKYEPEIQLQNAELTPFIQGEEKFFTYNREEGNTCIGHISGDFGNDGERFNSSWRGRENDRNTPEFQTEMHSAVYALRHDLLKDYASMSAYCESHPEAMIDSGDTYKRYGFKLETDTSRYYAQCFFGESMRDARFIIYAYDNTAPELGLFKPMGDWSMTKDYQGAEPFNDGSRPLLAETAFADIVISGIPGKDEIHIGVYPYGNMAEHYYEGQTASKELALQTGVDIAKYINANTDVTFTDGGFKHFFTGLQLSGVRMQDSMGEVSVQPAFGVVAPAAANERNMFYRNDTENSLCVGYLRGDHGRNGAESHHNWFDGDGGRKTPEFQSEFQAVMDTLRQGVLKDLKSAQEFCYKNPEAQMPGDIHRYGFKLETESRQYFVRCTVLRDDYFYVFAYDKAAAREQERPSEEKPSVRKQIRDAQKAPKALRKTKSTEKTKDGAEL